MALGEAGCMGGRRLFRVPLAVVDGHTHPSERLVAEVKA